jgi:hypothetical protein
MSPLLKASPNWRIVVSTPVSACAAEAHTSAASAIRIFISAPHSCHLATLTQQNSEAMTNVRYWRKAVIFGRAWNALTINGAISKYVG